MYLVSGLINENAFLSGQGSLCPNVVLIVQMTPQLMSHSSRLSNALTQSAISPQSEDLLEVQNEEII